MYYVIIEVLTNSGENNVLLLIEINTMARSGIQYSDVQQAIDTLLARGDAPSVQRIREVLGTGSFTTISEHFRRWRIEREQNRDVPPPKGVPEVVVSVASELWLEAQNVANQALAHYREEANRQVETAQKQAAEAAQHAANAEQRENALAEHLRHTEQRLEAVNREFAASQAKENQWQLQAEKADRQTEGYRQQLAEAEQNLAVLKTHFADEQQKQQATWQERLAREEQRNEAAEGKLMALLDTLRQERAQEEKALQKRLQHWEQRANTLDKELQIKKAELQQQQLESSTQQQRIAELECDNAAREEQCAKLQGEIDKALLALTRQQQQTAQDDEWQQQLWQRMEDLQAQLTALPETLAPKAQESHESNK